MKLIAAFLLLSFSFLNAQNHFPGGVTGAETWYMIDYDDLTQEVYPNHATAFIKISPCGNPGTKSLFNFNHSVSTEGLCLTYNTSLESTTSRNVFFVGEVSDPNPNYSHITTGWNPLLNGLPQVSPSNPITNRFDLSTKIAYVDNKYSQYQSIGNANINFYHWNIYQTHKKLKSYGPIGETSFYIGKEFNNSIIQRQADYFKGNFPEFISFPFELSANERNRVESYLALKYGITLDSDKSYKSATNIVFWKDINNDIFKNRIFGIGRDDISGLNQLQSESVHKKDYLVASVKELVETNPKKQELVSIDDRHFIVFGDNSENDALVWENDFNVLFLHRIWLSQNTGNKAPDIPMYFKLNLAGDIQQKLHDNPDLKLWMLHDMYVNNQEESDFNSQYVEYYEPASMDGLNYAYFEEISFDIDEGKYDQFTFGVGPEMIVQARFLTGDCDSPTVKTEVVITGGRAPYTVYITRVGGSQETYNINENTMFFDAYSGETYLIEVYDSQGLFAETIIDVFAPQLSVDFGPDQVLSTNQQQVVLDAGQGVNDPEATYKWYRNGILLEHYESTLTVSQPGEYTVVIIAGNHICEVSDTIEISYSFTGSVQSQLDCENPYGSVTLSLSGGIPPFTTTITGSGQIINQVHNVETFLFNQVNFGSHTLTTTDSAGNMYQYSFSIQDPMIGVELDLAGQMQQIGCTPIYYDYLDYPLFDCYISSFTIDASALVTNPNVSYEWFVNGQSTGINTPVIEIYMDQQTSGGTKEFMVKVTNLTTGCFATETFGMKGYWWPQEAMAASQDNADQSDQEKEPETSAAITTKVYPNPTNPNETFYYEISADYTFEGTVTIYSPTGALILQQEIAGQDSYTLPFSLLQAGVYFVCTKTNGNTITDKIIIR